MNNNDIAKNYAAIATNKAGIATNKTGVATNQGGIATNKAGIASNVAAIATNNDVIATNKAGVATNKADRVAAMASQSSLIGLNTDNLKSILGPADIVPTEPGCYLMRIPNKNGTYPPWLPKNATPSASDGNKPLSIENTATNPDPEWIEAWQSVPGETLEICSGAIRSSSAWFATHRSLWPSLNYKSIFVPKDGSAATRDFVNYANINQDTYRTTSTGWGDP